jgi:hypothetical protein
MPRVGAAAPGKVALEEARACRDWFASSKRALLAPFGISAGAIMPPWSDRIPRLRRSENVPAKAFRSICW